MTSDIVGVWFVYNGQTEQLETSVNQWRKATGAPVMFFNDAAAPLPSEIAGSLADYTELTTWPRNRNINGWAACHGILESLSTACRITGAGHAVKIDCDTLVLATGWIDRSAPFSGFHYGQGAWAAGMAYAVSAAALRVELDAWSSWWKDETFKAPEDAVISGRLIQRYGQGCCLHDFGKGLAGSYFADIDPARYAKVQVLTFQKCRAIKPDREVMAGYAAAGCPPL